MAERNTPVVKLNGSVIGKGLVIDIIEGTDVDITATYDNLAKEVNLTFASTAVGGGGDASFLGTHKWGND